MYQIIGARILLSHSNMKTFLPVFLDKVDLSLPLHLRKNILQGFL